MRAFRDWTALAAFCGLIFWLSAQASLPVKMHFEFQDKVQHALAYFVMALFSWRAFRHRLVERRWLALVSVAYCSVYGISDEWHQSFVPGREPGVGDWLADSLGAALAAVLLSAAGRNPLLAWMAR
ncbi:VanZ family protein [Methylomonas sp. UP202]|uniref:VanZ family protein n=1 Tax=Methylomonas sp. UP202 TaxID=3040943 RepID=UPI00247AA463|nr:VanZ family protein [Methylomonas sp. UP202]WGS87077.1 VanZ family protein [Methylomonas sp. UP202]